MSEQAHLLSSICQSVGPNKCEEGSRGPIKNAPNSKGCKGVYIRGLSLSHSGHNDKKNTQHMYDCHHCTQHTHTQFLLSF